MRNAERIKVLFFETEPYEIEVIPVEITTGGCAINLNLRCALSSKQRCKEHCPGFGKILITPKQITEYSIWRMTR